MSGQPATNKVYVPHPKQRQGGYDNIARPGWRAPSAKVEDKAMLSIQDLLDYCDLDRGEIEAVAEHEHLPITVAAELGEMLLETPEGVFRLHEMIIENMQHALAAGQLQHVQELAATYQHLQRNHPLPR
jgi:hypothetical protein